MSFNSKRAGNKASKYYAERNIQKLQNKLCNIEQFDQVVRKVEEMNDIDKEIFIEYFNAYEALGKCSIGCFTIQDCRRDLKEQMNILLDKKRTI